jgi:flagellar FliJ protein
VSVGYQFKFDKILHVKEKEKGDAMAAYHLSVQKFEEAAERLFELLKKKEDLESYQSSKLINGLAVQEIRHHQQFISNLQNSIEYYQKMVINARNRMNHFQEKLIESNTEVQKYSMMKEKDFVQYMDAIKFQEAKRMDDVSIQQFMNRGT